jgi:hypothetical protein
MKKLLLLLLLAGQAGAAGVVNENAEAEDAKADETNVEVIDEVCAKQMYSHIYI